MTTPLITSGQDWTTDLIEQIYEEIEQIAFDELGLTDIYPNSLEIVNYEQMLDAYCSIGLPVYYPHWSFGEQFVREYDAYVRGKMSLAYELVINSNPCISYLVEDNTMLMQTLVIAHAAFGHNYFFKNNYLFKKWTDANSIIDHMIYTRNLIRECEEKYGEGEVEKLIDIIHAISNYGVDKYQHTKPLTEEELNRLLIEREQWKQKNYNELWDTVPKTTEVDQTPSINQHGDVLKGETEENILRFIELYAPKLQPWQRDIIKSLRYVYQYFYPQSQTKMMNEGTATFIHYIIMERLHEKGIIDDGGMMEFMHAHSNVIYQPEYNSPYYSGLNPYALGFAMFQDIKRVATNPTPEDIEFLGNQSWIGSGDWMGTIKHAIANFKDDTFIQQYLTPHIIRKFKLFVIQDDENEEKLLVTDIHNAQGYKNIRTKLANSYNRNAYVPDISVTYANMYTDRILQLTHVAHNNVPLDIESATDTINYIAELWGYPVELHSTTDHGQTTVSLRSNIDDNLPVTDIKNSAGLEIYI